MIIWAIIVSIVFLLGSLTLHAFYTMVELRGYNRGLEDAEQIMKDVYQGTGYEDIK